MIIKLTKKEEIKLKGQAWQFCLWS